ncbi:MAG TPA: hypothetical protein VL992_19950 [Tepidisphaeraceae bacterium]|nr:hypothetical protein [Tepidisphaeraceae bacterium]
MKRSFTAQTWREGKWIIAQCLEVDVVSHGRTRQQALRHLREAVELYFEPPTKELLEIPGFLRSFRRGLRDIQAGRTMEWRRVRCDV